MTTVKAELLPNGGGVRYTASWRLGSSASLREILDADIQLYKAVRARSGNFGGHWTTHGAEIEIDPEGPDEWGYHKSATLVIRVEYTALSQKELPP